MTPSPTNTQVILVVDEIDNTMSTRQLTPRGATRVLGITPITPLATSTKQGLSNSPPWRKRHASRSCAPRRFRGGVTARWSPHPRRTRLGCTPPHECWKGDRTPTRCLGAGAARRWRSSHLPRTASLNHNLEPRPTLSHVIHREVFYF